MELLTRYLVVAGAGALGAALRFFVATVCGRWFDRTTFPIGTFVINISGSLFLGWFSTFALQRMIRQELRLAIGVGFVGAYTTFSSYMWESNDLLRSGSEWKAALNLFGSLVLGMAAVKTGIWMASR